MMQIQSSQGFVRFSTTFHFADESFSVPAGSVTRIDTIPIADQPVILLEFLLDPLDALGKLHTLLIAHFDLAPSNFVEEEGFPEQIVVVDLRIVLGGVWIQLQVFTYEAVFILIFLKG